MNTPVHHDQSSQVGLEVLPLVGELDIYQAASLKTRLLDAVSAQPNLALDLSGVIHLDCAGAQVLLLAARGAAHRGGALLILRHSQATEEVFDRLKLAHHFAPAH